jgi:hypothetical protein
VVKLIDVWPDEVPEKPVLGGYQQMLSADIFRGRYREDLAAAHPLAPNRALHYRIRLPKATQRIWHSPDAASAIELPVIASAVEAVVSH